MNEVNNSAVLETAGSMTESSILAQNERWRRVLSMQGPLDGNSTWKHVIIPDTTGSVEAARERSCGTAGG